MSIEICVSRSPITEIPPIITPTLSNVKKKKEEINTITLDKQLGKGGYGTVYLCTDEKNNNFAVKCIKTKDYGIPCLMEASIMSVINHPYLASSIKIHSTPRKLYIIQELAVCDLRIYRLNHEISNELCLRWIHSISQGISCLHRYNIIHGDIKSSNILVYSDNRLKLTDFTLSTHVNWSNKYRSCTPTHRPLEVWLNEKWDRKVDIWSFGCTIFEMVYGKTLFISQNRDASINALIDWYNYLPNMYKTKEISLKYRDKFHYSFSLPNSFNISSPLNQFMLSMLSLDSKSRPDIDTILRNDLITSYSIIPSMIINTPVTYLPIKTIKRVTKYLDGILSNDIVLELAINIYSRIVGMINANDKVKMMTCGWIANKLVKRENLSLNVLSFDLHEILQMERNICDYLSYRLYYKSSYVKIKENIIKS